MEGIFYFMIGELILIFILSIGLALLGLAIYPNNLRSDGIDSENITQFETGAALPPDDAIANFQRKQNETDVEYIYRATNVLHNAIAHRWPSDLEREYWPKSVKPKYNTCVPLQENYILWGLGFLPGYIGRYFEEYEFLNHKKAIERGLGQCSQQASAMYSLLTDRGFDVEYQSLDGHVVVEVTLDDGQYIIDSDYNVIVPHCLDEIKEDPSLVREYYSSATPIRDFMGKDTYPLDRIEMKYYPPYASFDPAKYELIIFERITYILIYLIPSAIIISIYFYISLTY